MAKYHVDRIASRYKAGEVRGATYADLMKEIIAKNAEAVSRAILRQDSEALQRQAKNHKRAVDKRVTLPDVSQVLPKRSVFIRKAAVTGNLMSDNLRDKLTKDLREVIKQPHFIYAKGERKGAMKEQVITEFEKIIKNTFENYTKKDPNLGMPTNIHAIAVTETRSAVNNIKDEHMNQLAKSNPNMTMKKTWKHNTNMLLGGRKFVRMGHLKLNGKTIPLNKSFTITDEKTGRTYSAMYPHDPSLPAGQVISCQCEIIYTLE